MRRRPFQMSLHQRCWLYASFVATVASGGTWAVIWHFFRQDADMAQPVENIMLKLHLAGAFVLLVALGAALPKHASKSWAAKVNRMPSGIFVAALVASAATGYGILAFYWETRTMHFVHIAAGVAVVLLLPLHIIVGRYLEKKRVAKNSREI